MIRLTKEQFLTCLKSNDPCTEYISELMYIRNGVKATSMDEQTQFETRQLVSKQIHGFRKIIQKMCISQYGTSQN
jgi:hypothetical protein